MVLHKTSFSLICEQPDAIDALDPDINQLEKVQILFLSINTIERMIPLPGLMNLKLLSLSSNKIKRIEGLKEVGKTLEELWISFNYIEKLSGLDHCDVLHTLLIGDNRIS